MKCEFHFYTSAPEDRQFVWKGLERSKYRREGEIDEKEEEATHDILDGVRRGVEIEQS